jgi:hypothetical protein
LPSRCTPGIWAASKQGVNCGNDAAGGVVKMPLRLDLDVRRLVENAHHPRGGQQRPDADVTRTP